MVLWGSLDALAAETLTCRTIRGRRAQWVSACFISALALI